MLFRWLVYPHFCRLNPVAGSKAPARCIGPAGSLVDLSSLLANGLGGSALPPVGRHKFDTAVAMSVIVPVHKLCNPQAALLDTPRVAARIALR